MAQLKHVEVWDKSALAAGAQRLAILTEITGASLTRKVGSEERATVSVPLTARKYASLVPGRWLRFEFTDGTWSEWRIKEIADASDTEGAATLTCGGYGSALAKCPLIGITDADGATSYRFDGVALTPAQHLSSYILPAASAGGLTFVVAGTLDATGLVDVTYDGDNPWTALTKLAEATGKELELERVSGEVRVHLRTQVGSGTTGGTLRVGDNAVVRRTRSELEQQTRVVGLGQDGITIGDAVWKVTGISGTTFTLADPAGGDGPILRDDQLNGWYLEAANRTTRTQITDSTRSTQQVVVASATGFAVGDLVRVRTTAGGGRVTYLDDPVQVAAFGVLSGEPLRRDDLPETCNLLPNPTQAAWAGASSDPADLWAKVGASTVTRTTAAQYVETGGKSARVQTSADGQGYATPLVSLGLSLIRPYVSAQVTFYLAAGKVRVEMVATNGTQTWIVPDGLVPEKKAVSSQLGAFITVGVAGINLHALGATAVRLRVVQDGTGTADFYVDRAQISESAGQLPFVDGAGPTKLWQAVNQRLALVAPTRVRYEVTAIDFYRLDGSRYPYRQFKLGAQHTLHDPVLGVVDGVRVLELVEDLLVEAQTSLTLSNLPEDLASLFDPDPASRLAGNIAAAPVQAAVRTVVDASTSNPNRVSSASAGFTSADLGKTVWVLGGATGNAILKGTITTIVSTTQVALSTNIGAFVTNATAIIGDAAEVATLAASVGGTRAGAALLNENGTLADGVKDVNGRDAKRFFGKVSSTDPDNADTIGAQPGTTYIPQIPLLTITITYGSADADSIDVTVTGADPTGGAAPSISYTSSGSVTDLGSGNYRLARPSSSAGPLLIRFAATKTGRETAYGYVLVPEQSAGGSVPPSIDAFYVDSTSTSPNDIVVKWTASNAPGGATYSLYRTNDHPDDANTPVLVTSSASSPYTDNSHPLDIVAKGTFGSVLVRVDYELRMISSGVVVATATCSVNVYALYVA